MKKTTPHTPSRSIATWLARILDRIDRFALREPDLQALANGWTVRRGRPFTRTYRDERWDHISPCDACSASGTRAGVDCPACRGTGLCYVPQTEEVSHL